MLDKLKNISNKKIIIVSLCFIVIVLLLGFTYAYWTRTFTQTGNNVSTFDCFNIQFQENADGIAMSDGYPQTDEEGLNSEAYEVTIENTCNTVASYNVVLNKLNESTLDDSHVKVAVDNNIKLLSKTEQIASSVTGATKGRIINTGLLPGEASKTISIRSWMDENTSIEEGTNKTFAYKITIEATTASKTLATIILENNSISSYVPTFLAGEPIKKFYDETYEESANLVFQDNMKLATGIKIYDYGFFGLENATTVSKLDNTSVGKYFCGSDPSEESCTMVYEVKEVTEVNGEYTISKVVGHYIGISSELTTNSGLYKTEDDKGTSYYYRGDVNNYVSFANQLWRIVRINGDGSVRLIKNDVIGTSPFNSFNVSSASEKYVGYTYDNEHICTINNPCNTNDGTSSVIKTYLEKWYDDNLAEYDNKITLSSFCNDTTIAYEDETNTYFSSHYRVDTGNPSLLCLNTNKTYGGFYNLKIGLITADEVDFAGIPYYYTGSTFTNNPTTNYLNSASTNLSYLTFSPYGIAKNRQISLSMSFSNDGQASSLSSASPNYSIRPVISLDSAVKINSGNGTKEKPYIVQ